MPDIVICEFMDQAAVDWLSDKADVHYDPNLVDDTDALHAAIATVPALIVRSSARIDETLLQAGPQLKVVGRLGVGLERFDLDACARRGVVVVKSTGANALSVAEYVIAMALTLQRPNAYHARDHVASGAWPRLELVGRETAGKTLGIVGLGSIGRVVSRHARAVGMQVTAYDPYVPVDDAAWTDIGHCNTLEQLVAGADVITLHTPLTDETRGMINGQVFAVARKGSVIINSARGPVIDNAALVDAMHNGIIAGAAIDVFEHEPLSADAADIFKHVDNLVLTPHIAGVTHESNARVSQMTAEGVLAVLQR